MCKYKKSTSKQKQKQKQAKKRDERRIPAENGAPEIAKKKRQKDKSQK